METQYQALLERATAVGEEHPKSYVVIDAETLAVLGTGTDAEKVFRKVMENLEPGQVPMIYQKPKDGELLIL